MPNPESRESDLEDPREIGEEAKEVIKNFQEAKTLKDENEEDRNKLLQDFYRSLMTIATPEDSRFFNISDKDLKEILLEGKRRAGYNYLSVGGGTSGQRIYFINHISVPKGEDPAKYGHDLLPEQFQGQYELESKDKKPRWMAYYKPEGSDWSHGQLYWERFYRCFGDEVVDLLQKLKTEENN